MIIYYPEYKITSKMKIVHSGSENSSKIFMIVIEKPSYIINLKYNNYIIHIQDGIKDSKYIYIHGRNYIHFKNLQNFSRFFLKNYYLYLKKII